MAVGTILGVAKKLGVHRRMVREAVENAVPAKRKKSGRKSTRLIAEVLLERRGRSEGTREMIGLLQAIGRMPIPTWAQTLRVHLSSRQFSNS
jgi:hypothetical protein